MRENMMTLANNRKVEVAVFEPTHPIGTLQILHGMAEHMERYYPVARYFEAMGYLVVMHNHRGHGKTIAEQERGHFDRMDELVLDAHEILESFIIKDHPVILLGHSMGSIIARQYAVMFPEQFDAMILSGTSYYEGRQKSARAALKVLKKVMPASTRVSAVNQLTLKQFNKKIKPLETESDWLSWNKDNVQLFISDPHTGFLMSIQSLEQILTTMKTTQDKKNLKRMNHQLPILLVSGEDDAFSNYGKGIKKLGRCYKEAGFEHVTIQLYSHSRHEVLFESNHDEVMDRITLWLKGQLNDE